MADKTPDQLTAITTVSDSDLVLIYDMGASLLKKQTFLNFTTQVAAGLSGQLLQASANLGDLTSASAARANLGLGTAATLASTAVFQVANNLSEVANAVTARANLGAAASSSPTITSGMTLSGTTKLTPLAIGAADIDFSAQEVQTKSISTNTAFTFSNLTSGKAQVVIFVLSITSGAVPSWPVGTKFQGGTNFSASLGNGEHWIAAATKNGSDVVLRLCMKAVA